MLIGDELRQIASNKNNETAICIAHKLYDMIIDEAYAIAKNGLYSFELKRDKYNELYSSKLEILIFNTLLELLKVEKIVLKKECLCRDSYVYKVEY